MMSKKKRDTMVSAAATGVNPAPTAGPVLSAPLVIKPGTTSTYFPGVHALVFCPTYRWLQPSNAEYVAQRTSSRPFYKGFSESFEFIVNDGSQWYHRRIAFCTKDYALLPLLMRASVGAQETAASPTERIMRDMSGETSGNYQQALTNLYGEIFEGIATTDWANPMTAKLDSSFVNTSQT